MSKIAREIVDTIADKELANAKDLINQGIKEKAAQAVDFKRVESQTTLVMTASSKLSVTVLSSVSCSHFLHARSRQRSLNFICYRPAGQIA